MVALVAGMALHLDIHPAVENLQAEVDLLLLSVGHDLLVAIDAVLDAHIVRNVLAETGERDDAGEPVLGAGVDGVLEFLQTHIMMLGIVHSLLEPVAARDGADKTVLLQGGPITRLGQLDALAAKPLGDLAGLLDVPVVFEAPVDNGLVNTTFSGASSGASAIAGARAKG